MWVKVDPHDILSETIARAAECLRGGGLVAFPTETVYGIAVRADDADAVDRVYRLKGRPQRKPLAYHIGSIETYERLVPDPPLLARRLVDRYWPGPLTLVLPDRRGGTIGVRFPAHRVAQALLSEVGSDTFIVATSANISGEPALTSGEQVREILGDRLDMILDAGSTDLEQASTVVEVQDTSWRVLREGLIDESAMRQTVTRLFLFVCSGNTCRSPMASALFRQMLIERFDAPDGDLSRYGIRVESAGTMAFPGGGASPGAVAAMEELGLTLDGHQTQPVTPALIHEAEQIFCMTEEQLRVVRAMAPDATAELHLVDPTGQNTLDPFGGSLGLYRKTALQIQDHLRARIDGMLGQRENPSGEASAPGDGAAS